MACDRDNEDTRRQTMTRTDMPVKLAARDDPDTTFPVKPNTNEACALRYLVMHEGYGFSPAELAEETDIPTGSAPKTLQRLLEKEIIKQTTDGYYYAPPEQIEQLRSYLTSIQSLGTLHATFGEDWYEQTPEWADGLPDLGTDTVPTEATDSAETGPDPTQNDA
jgi:hypothetical protein